jgi:hypothetical protein
MESEKRTVIEYLDNKMEIEILQDAAEFWVRREKRVLMKEESQKGWKMFASKLGDKKIAKTPKIKLKGNNTHVVSPGKRFWFTELQTMPKILIWLLTHIAQILSVWLSVKEYSL